jgi:hypothetical protein
MMNEMKMLGTPRKGYAMNAAKLVTIGRIAQISREKKRSHLQTKEGARQRKLMLHGKAIALHLIHHQALAQVMKAK